MFTTEPDFQQLKKLWTLKQVVESGSLKQAATRGKVTVSAVSQALTHLEKSLGRKLFVKKDRRLFPTAFCEEILRNIDPAFKSFAFLQNLTERTCQTPSMSWLDFGITECMAALVLPGFVQRMREKQPHMKLTLRVGKCRELTRLVKAGNLCMALVTENDAMKGVTVYPLIEERLGLYYSAQHRTDQHSPPVGEVASMVPPGEGYPDYYSAFARVVDRDFRRTLQSDSYETLYALATSATMPAILPERMAMRTPGLLREIPLPEPVRNRATFGRFKICMVSEKVCDPAEDQFLLDELKSLL